MAEQSFGAPAGRNPSKASGFATKVAVKSGPPSIGKNPPAQHITGKLGDGMSSMPGSKGKGQMVKTVRSNPISGEANMQKGNTAMGSGSVKSGFV